MITSWSVLTPTNLSNIVPNESTFTTVGTLLTWYSDNTVFCMSAFTFITGMPDSAAFVITGAKALQGSQLLVDMYISLFIAYTNSSITPTASLITKITIATVGSVTIKP